MRVIRIGRRHAELPRSLRPNSRFTHDLGHRLAIALRPTLPQRAMHTHGPIALTAQAMDFPNFLNQRGPLRRGRARRTLPPRIKPAARHLQHRALNHDRPLAPMLMDEGVSHRDSFAKKTVAFFKISRSIRSRSFSARKRRFSSSNADG